MLHGFRLIVFVFFVCFGISFFQIAWAADAYFGPSSGIISGRELQVDVLIDTEEVAVNNVEMTVRFPNDLLEITSVSSTDSIFSLWVGAPKFSNESGTLSFTAGAPTPGFTGNAGKILGIVFKVKSAGSAALTFSSTVIRANDGYGTNVFQNGIKASFILDPKIPGPGDVLNPPTFTEYPKELQQGNMLVVHGLTYPQSKIILWIQKDSEDEKSINLESDQNGRFLFSLEEPVREGIYRLWAEVLSSNGLASLPSEKIAIGVNHPALDTRIVLLVVMALLLVFILWYAWRAWVRSKERLQKETLEAESSLHTAFGSLRENRKRLEMFEVARTKRTLTTEEEQIVAWLKRDLDNVEKTVEKEIVDIEEEIK